jgi:hypothetical protein
MKKYFGKFLTWNVKILSLFLRGYSEMSETFLAKDVGQIGVMFFIFIYQFHSIIHNYTPL